MTTFRAFLAFILLAPFLALAAFGLDEAPGAGRAAPAVPDALRLDLSGEWRFALDSEDEGLVARWQDHELSGTIPLPGTTDLAGIGEPDPDVTAGHLVRTHRYVGPAWYQRDVTLPEAWRGRTVTLFLERCLWETRVYLDGRPAGAANSLTTPHRHDLGFLTPGRHRLTVRVDNRPQVNLGVMCHAYTEETQSIWNGLTGRLELRARDPVRIRKLRLLPDLTAGAVLVQVELENLTSGEMSGRITARLEREGLRLGETAARISMARKRNRVNLDLEAECPVVPWDEFDPALYRVVVRWEGSGFASERVEDFGFREIRRDGRHMLLNGRRIQLRGTVECCVFPATGHPPTDVTAWQRIFRTCKAWGLNHMRFHTWCPPEAAFAAADREGFYLQPETPLWIDGWMKVPLFGEDPEVAAFIETEANRILEAYGNHPSFVMLSLGNELHLDSDYEALQNLVNGLREGDPRRLYGICTARALTEADDYYVTHATPGGAARGLGRPGTDWDFTAAVESVAVPLISHENGQRPVFPDYETLHRYKGPLKPKNLEVFRDALAARGMADRNRDFTRASEAWAVIQYRHEIEAILRTPDYCGFQLLQLNDFSGQGEALVGLLDSFWKPKGVFPPEAFARFCGPTVPLCRFERYLWTRGEILEARTLVSHFGPTDLAHVETRWSLEAPDGSLAASGKLPDAEVPAGTLKDLGGFSVRLGEEGDGKTFPPGRYRLSLTLDGGDAGGFWNAWDLWILPSAGPAPEATDPSGRPVLYRHRLDEAARAHLAAGGRVLLNPIHVRNDHVMKGRFFSVYWSTKFFPSRDGTLGLWCDPAHPALAGFPASPHGDWIWRPLVEGAKVFVLDDAPLGYRPLVEPVSDFHLNHRLGAVFETAIGPGKLLVCGLNLDGNHPASALFRDGLLRYAASKAFAPAPALDEDLLETLLDEGPPPRSEAGEALNVLCAAAVTRLNRNLPWKASLDRILCASEGYGVELVEGGVWMDDQGAAWHGNPLKARVRLPRGVHGKLHLHVHDWNDNGRTGVIDVEGRKTEVGDHRGKGRWFVFDILREDALDGVLDITARAHTGPNLMITQVLFVPVE